MRARPYDLLPSGHGFLVATSLSVLLLVSLCACARIEDRSLLTGDPCAAPCWQNLTPGVSTEADVSRELAASPLVQRDTLQYAPARDYNSPAYFAWRGRGNRESREYYNRAYLDDGRVSRIEVYPGSDLSLDRIVAELGDPEYVHAAFYPGSVLGFIVVLDYPARGVSFMAGGNIGSRDDILVGERVIRIPEETSLIRVDYYAPAPLERVLSYAFSYHPESVSRYLDETRPWSGFERVQLGSRPRW